MEINSSGSSDLLGLSSPVSNGPTTIPLTSSNSASNELNDAFSNFMSAPPIQENSDLTKMSTTIKTDGIAAGEISLEKQEADFFSQVTGEKDQAKMTKDSIMALYAKAPAPTNLANFNNTNSSGFTTNFNNAQGFMQQPQHQMQQQQLQQQQPQFGAQNFNNQFGMNLMGQNQQSPQNLMFKMGQTPQMMGGQLQGFNNIHPQQQQQQQSFAQFPIQAFPTTQNSNFNKPPQQSPAGMGNLNQQFGNINLGNVWQ